jgi:hypothetical protein
LVGTLSASGCGATKVAGRQVVVTPPKKLVSIITDRLTRGMCLPSLLGALQPVDLLFEFGDPLFALHERLSASVRFRAVTGRPSRQLPRLGW